MHVIYIYSTYMTEETRTTNIGVVSMAGKPRTIGARISISLMDGPSNHANHYSIDLHRQVRSISVIKQHWFWVQPC